LCISYQVEKGVTTITDVDLVDGNLKYNSHSLDIPIDLTEILKQNDNSHTYYNTEVVKAMPSDARRIAGLYMDVYNGKYPLTEFTQRDSVEQALLDQKYAWYIAKFGNEVVGSGVGVPDIWNKSYEIGRMVVRKDFGNLGIAKDIHLSVREDSKLADYSLEWSIMRSDIGLSASSSLGLDFAGFLPGKYNVEYRELHGFFSKIVSGAIRILPIKTVLKMQNQKHGANSVKGFYPKNIIVGSGAGTTENSITYKKTPICDSITITGVVGDDIDVLLRGLSKGDAGKAKYTEVTVLADKVEEIKEMAKNDFYPWAYLPAWYVENNRRFDCILLTKSEDSTILAEQAKRIGSQMRQKLCQYQDILAKGLMD